MADVFGDLSLFSEFEKDREAKGSFIRYDEDSLKSRIIFEDTGEDEDNAESDSTEEYTEHSAKHIAGAVVSNEELEIEADEKQFEDEELQAEDEYQFHDDLIKEDDKTSSNGASSVDKREDTILSAEDEERAAWLNEQLHAEAAEEAKKLNISLQQSIYERNKYQRYAKILDSTRYVPDDESPAVQLIFNNNSFARKYRQQIEQFIKGLLWEEFHSPNQDTVSEIIVKPGVPTCIDINKNLPVEKRTEKMRQKHALIGNSQFHKQFLIDFLGWPFTVAEPTRCNVNWEIPLYGQVFNEVYADPTNKAKKAVKKQKAVCWNCGEENHAVIDCKQPRNPAKISANRRDFLAQQQLQQQNSFEPKFIGPSRYHLDPELASKFLKFKPGVVSEDLRLSLGLNPDQLPQHIYKMRLFGYPPGWLSEARQVQSGVTIFDKTGRVTLITGECLEDGELDDGDKAGEYDVNKIIEYPGFTVPVPLGYVDEHSSFKMPPIQQHQLKKTLMTQSNEKSSNKKRKRDKEQMEDVAKKAKTEDSSREEEEGGMNNDSHVREEGEEEEEEEEGSPEIRDESSPMETTNGNTEMAAPSTPSADILLTAKITPSTGRSSSTISISKQYGTPVLIREKSSLPDATKFGQGIEEHLPYENLPNSTGTFERMKDLIDVIRNRVKK